LYRRFPDFAEGHLARLRAYIVSRATCSRVAAKLGLGKLLRQYAGAGGEGNDAAQLQSNQNVLADLTESLIGAVYLTFGYEAVRPAVIEVFEKECRAATSTTRRSRRSTGPAAGQSVGRSRARGPPHNREFEIEAVVDGAKPLGGLAPARSAPNRGRGRALHDRRRARRPPGAPGAKPAASWRRTGAGPDEGVRRARRRIRAGAGRGRTGGRG
jgi:ribonuclease-3